MVVKKVKKVKKVNKVNKKVTFGKLSVRKNSKTKLSRPRSLPRRTPRPHPLPRPHPPRNGCIMSISGPFIPADVSCYKNKNNCEMSVVGQFLPNKVSCTGNTGSTTTPTPTPENCKDFSEF